MAKKKVVMDAVVTHVDYPKEGVMDGYQRCDLKIDGLKFDGVLMLQPVYEYLTKTEGKTKNRLWLQKSRGGFVMAAIETESGEKHVAQIKPVEHLHGLLLGSLIGIIPGIAAGAFFDDMELGIFCYLIVIGLVWYKVNRKVAATLDLSTYEQGTSADLGTKMFGIS